jgi:hypothetical protein
MQVFGGCSIFWQDKEGGELGEVRPNTEGLAVVASCFGGKSRMFPEEREPFGRNRCEKRKLCLTLTHSLP